MKFRRLLVIGVAMLALAGCWVPKSEFAEYQARIAAKGDSVNTFAAGVMENITWLRQSVITLCPNCGPPDPPPPPPKGEWK